MIGWVLIQNGYNTTTQAVDFGNTKFYSTPDWNPEPTAALQKHNVLLWDNMRERMVLGFEDVARTQPTCDNDFNDALFYVTATPTSSIYNPGIPRFVNGGGCPDTDGDGVNDCQDDFPNDDDRAFKVYTPYDSGFTSIGFEDLWPAKGDWDFNDLLLDINYMHVTSAENQLVDFEYTSVVRHVGATFQNGFGIEFPLTSSNLSGVTGTDYTSNIITNTAAGVEAGQSNAVVVFFDDAHDQLYDTMVISASLNSTVSFAQFVVDELNPFCISNATRGREIHLKGKPATDLASASFYGQVDDITDGSSTWYQTVDGEPWAISVSHEYAPPVESVSIENGYLKWSIWVASGGETYPDWYQNDPGYRNPANLQ